MSLIGKRTVVIRLLILMVLLIIQPNITNAHAGNQKPRKHAEQLNQNKLIMTVRSSRDAVFVSDLQMVSRELNSALRTAKQVTAIEVDFYPDIELTLPLEKETTVFRLERAGNLWDEKHALTIIFPKNMADKLIRLADSLRMQHYGKLISWQQSQQLLPNKAFFTVTELETGLTFQVQRRAGSDHADVQPVTKEDSRIMKQIYNGKWSWKRKAILIHSQDSWIAASMNGMPHGGDGIPENGFSGHFCIHFQGSSTHKSDSPDPAHQIMVHKAAGQVQPYLDTVAPLVLAKTFIEVMYHQDKELLQQLGEDMSKDKLASFISQMDSLVSIRENTPPKAKELADDQSLGDLLMTEIKLPVSIHELNKPRRNGYYVFLIKRESLDSPWRIQDVAS